MRESASVLRPARLRVQGEAVVLRSLPRQGVHRRKALGRRQLLGGSRAELTPTYCSLIPRHASLVAVPAVPLARRRAQVHNRRALVPRGLRPLDHRQPLRRRRDHEAHRHHGGQRPQLAPGTFSAPDAGGPAAAVCRLLTAVHVVRDVGRQTCTLCSVEGEPAIGACIKCYRDDCEVRGTAPSVRRCRIRRDPYTVASCGLAVGRRRSTCTPRAPSG